MQKRPTHIGGQTSKQAKADYKKHGPRISTQEARQLQRGAELLERAEKIKQNERRRKAAKEKRLQKEQRERDARRNQGVASQLPPKIAASQTLLNGFLRPRERTESPCQLRRARLHALNDADDYGATDVEKATLTSSDETQPASNSEVVASEQITGTSQLLEDTFLEDFNVSSPDTHDKSVQGRLPSQDTVSEATDAYKQSEEQTAKGISDDLDSFLDSNTQLEREIDCLPTRRVTIINSNLDTTRNIPPSDRPTAPVHQDSMPFLSTQDVNFSLDELEEPSSQSKSPQLNGKTQNTLMPPPMRAVDDVGVFMSKPRPSMLPAHWPTSTANQTSKSAALDATDDRMLMPPPPRPLHADVHPSHIAASEQAHNRARMQPRRPDYVHPPSYGGLAAGDNPVVCQPQSKSPPIRPRLPFSNDFKTAAQLQAILEMSVDDFELSTQDCREISA